MKENVKEQQKEIIIYPDFGMLGIIVVCCILSYFLIAQRYQGGTSVGTPDPRFLLIIGAVLLAVKSKTVKISQDQICVTYCWIIKRRVSCDRICGVEIMTTEKGRSLFFLLDEQKPLSQSDKRIKRWRIYFDPKVIAISMSEKTWEKTAEKITALFPGIVSVDEKTGDGLREP